MSVSGFISTAVATAAAATSIEDPLALKEERQVLVDVVASIFRLAVGSLVEWIGQRD